MRRRRSIRPPGAAQQRRRLVVVALLGALGSLGLGLRAAQLQTLDAEFLRDRYDRQNSAKIDLPRQRGEIVDRNGQRLAVSADAESVAASPRRIGDRRAVARRLAPTLRVSQRELERRLAPDRGFVWLKRWLKPDQAEAVRRLGLQGVSLYPERKRFYPSRELGAAYLGFVGRDGEGLSGIELAFDSLLRGAATEVRARRDGRGRLLAEAGEVGSRAGGRLVLTLDSKLQNFAEAALDRALAATGARRAMLVALDPRNGDVLAVAERPSFNPNRFWLENPEAFRSRVFVDAFEPGSTLKPFAVASALEAGLVRPGDRFDCEEGSWRIRDRVIHDHEPHGVLTVSDIVRVSSNIGAAKIADRLGSARLVRGLRAFGFGRPTGSSFAGEAAGVVRDLRETQSVERANLAFGQGISVTALQLASAVSVLANGGRRVTPRLALRLERGDDRLEWPSGLGERVVSERTARSLMRMLRAVVESGSGRAAALDHFAVAGKTGTAQKAVEGRYDPHRYVASFVGVVPADAPRLVMAVVLDEPRGVRFGGVVAAPVFREVASYAVEELRVPRREKG